MTMMKLVGLALVALFIDSSATSLSAPEISAKSEIGKQLLSSARRLDEENDNEEIYFDWVASYSVKFQGCHHIMQWNDEADDENDVRIATKRLIRFRLCPSDSCSANKAAGCSSGYGDYVIDMDTFMESWFEAKKKSIEYNCEYFLNNNCNCGDNDDEDGDNDQEYCEYDCFNDAEMTECIDQNPYEDDEAQEEFNLEDYMACAAIDIPDNDNNNNNEDEEGEGDEDRKLEDEEENDGYFVGPYCSEQGGAVTLGLFTDDACTVPAEDVTFKSLMGFALPYSEESLVDAGCLECVEKDGDENENDQQDADQVSESCEMMYESAGKCELNYPEGMLYYEPNTGACNYIEGIRIVRQDGIIDTGSGRPSAVATAFIVIFAMAFAAMAFYVWYLRTRLGVKKNSLL